MALAGCGGTPATVQARAGFAYGQVRTGTVNGLGTVLTNPSGHTLYRFTGDRRNVASCVSNACVVTWTPFLLPPDIMTPTAGHGVRRSDLGEIHNPDGGVQVTYRGWPLYVYARDHAAREARGNGIRMDGGRWLVATPTMPPAPSG